MDKVEFVQLAAKLRRDMPRNRDVMALCGEAERLAAVSNAPKVVSNDLSKDKLRAAYNQYMREKMRECRAKKKAAP
jgi:hypothetical protein